MKLIIKWLMVVGLGVFFSLRVAGRQDTPIVWKHDKAAWLGLSRDGSLLLSKSFYGAEHQIRIWDVARRRFAGFLPLSRYEEASIMALSDDGRRLIVRRETYEAYETLAEYKARHPAYPGDVVSYEGWALGLGGVSSKKMWEIRRKKKQGLEEIQAAVFQGRRILLLWPHRIETRDADGHLLRSITLRPGSGWGGMVSGGLSENGRMAVCSYEWQAVIFSTLSGRPVHTLQPPPSLNLVGFSFDGRTAAGVSQERTDPGLNQEGYSEIITHRWLWDVASGKALPEWGDESGDTSGFGLTFSPNGRALLRKVVSWNLSGGRARVASVALEFRDVRTHKRAAFQIPHPWGDKDTRQPRGVSLSGDGKVVAALDWEGNIWVQSGKR